MIDKLPNRFNMFIEQFFGIDVLDDYSVHLMPEVRQALFKKEYALVIIGGGITRDIQINDTNCNCDFKKYYRDLEIKLILQQLEKIQLKFPLLRETRCFCKREKYLRLTLKENLNHYS